LLLGPKNSERFRFWRGPIVGHTVSHAWFSYACCLFLEFGPLTRGTWVDYSGRVHKFIRGEWSITSMESWPSWKLSRGGSLLAFSEEPPLIRRRAFRQLIGRRLNRMEIDDQSQSTRLIFSRDIVLETQTELRHYRGKPHWLLHGLETGDDAWPEIVLDPH
jgi:hypothetical protein